jgi:hypothetical protein
MAAARIVLGSYLLADYPEGGGHWSAFLQFLLGLDALGVDVYWFELMLPSDDPAHDKRLIRIFLRRFAQLGFRDRTAVLYGSSPEYDDVSFESVRTYGLSRARVAEITASADAVWNFCLGFPPSLLAQFKRRVLIDTDPGVYQLSAADWDMGFNDHEAFVTVGLRIGKPDCEVPTCGVDWHPLLMPIHLPAWPPEPDPGPAAPVTTVTNLWGSEFELGDRTFTCDKHEVFWRYLSLPKLTGRPFELATNMDEGDDEGDRKTFLSAGWRLADPERVVRTPRRYRDYIRRSRAELGCPKPIYRDLRTGWFSDRSAAYLASARPVITETTGFEHVLPTGAGLLTVSNIDEAAEAVAEIDGNHARHQSAARAIAEEFFDARKCLAGILELS